jgi:TamB, inner membrane protein subunit of TAM complex
VAKDGHIVSEMGGGWRRRAIVALCLFGALLLIFHRPVLLTIGRELVRHYAAKGNLRADFRLEGTVFTNLSVRNLHVVPIGRSAVESIDVDLVHIDYSLLGLIRHGMSQFLDNVDVHSARVVFNPGNALEEIHPKKKPKRTKQELPAVFPGHLRISDATLIVRDSPRDLVIEHVDFDLSPRQAGQLRIEKLQLPTAQSWSNIAGQTSYANKNLVLRDLALNDQDRIRLLNVDASHIDTKQLSINLDVAIGGGTISGTGMFNETASSLNAKIHLAAAKVSADSFNKYLDLPEGFISGDIEHFVVDLTGGLDAPRTWNGTISAQVNDFSSGQFGFDRGVLDVMARDGTATLRSADIVQGNNESHLHGSAELPNELSGFGRSPATLEIAAKAPDLSQVSASTGEKISGSAEVSGKIDIVNAKLEANLDITAEQLGFADGTIEKVTANVKASKIMTPGNAADQPTHKATARQGTVATTAAKTPWFADLHSKIVLDMSKIRFRDYAIDSMSGTLSGANDVLKIDQLDIGRKENKLAITGRYNLPEDLRRVTSQPAQLNVSLNANELGDYWAVESPDKMTGPLQVMGQLEWKDGLANGQLSIFGAGLKTRDLIFKQLSAQCYVVNNTIYLNDLTASLNEQDFVSANGIVDLRAPYHYVGKLSANVTDLSRLKPLLHASGNQKELAGSLVIDWEGSGEAMKFKNNGKLKLALENGRYGNLQSLQTNVDATYSPEGLDVPTIFLRSDRMDFQAIVQAKGDTLEITKIQLDQGEAKYASGYISIPFVWKNLGSDAPVVPSTGKVVADFRSENIDIKKLFEDIGAEPAAAGTLNVKLEAAGTISDLDARLEVEMRDLRSEKLPSLEPATFNLSAQSQHDQLTVSGKLQQAKIQPMELTARFPLNVPKIVREKKLPDDTPVQGNVRLPRSSINFVRQFIPSVQQLDGDVGLDVDLGGTVARPVFKGQANMTVNVARTNDPTLPALQNFKGRLNFENDSLNFEQFTGELSGGRFTLSGRITFPKLTAANLDLRLKSDSALVARSDALTVRTDTDIRFVGPINSASVTGQIALTNSQFLKNVDLIPIGLPGRPAPEPPAAHPQLSFPAPPLRDWKFDVAIKTKDPVLIRGNLATGGAVADLHFIGTGLHPGLKGQVRLQNVEATLPFSRLEIAYGFLYFDPGDSLNPKIDLHGTSVVQDYTIHVYIYGTSLAPEAVFSSEPPLPQEEIISLLATGTTREQLTGNNNVLAGRAAMLLVQQVYRKIFKKGQATQSNSVFNRLSVDVGTVDPRTGQQQATARFKINDKFVVVGDIGVSGDYRGILKYLIRFH